MSVATTDTPLSPSVQQFLAANRTMLITGKTVYRAPMVKSCLLPWAYAKKSLAVEEDISYGITVGDVVFPNGQT